jgi:protein NRD1
MASVDDLRSLLQSLTALKPPGVSKSKINEINNLCIAHIGVGRLFSDTYNGLTCVQSDGAIIDTIGSHFSSAPNTHKLGVLYVVDSVTRKWVEKAVLAAQPLIGSAAAPGTFASGIHKMTEILPTMMNDLITSAPASQKVS